MDKDAEREFREYVAAKQGTLFRAAVLLTGHREDAEDLLQQALTKLALRWGEVAERGSPDAYVRKILYHQHISWWRILRHRHEYAMAVPPDVDAATDVAGDSVLRIALAEILGKLTSRQRAVVVLRYYEDLPEAETAAILGCSVGTVRSQTHRTLSKLRALCPELSIIRETV